MDLLQEISKHLKSESGQLWNKLYDLAYDATIGLAKLYKHKTLELAKIMAASVYVQGLRLARKHMLLLFTAVFAAVLLAVTVVLVPIAMILVTTWTPVVKASLIGALGLVYSGTIFVCLNTVFSEEKWMKASGFQELLDSIDTSK